ncbi:MAG: aromatic ring-hydroxylating dioxygenase subunit alpha [Proteobacteria bacterium]|nr:aromatic ring-hydroxylating dioxygenase subunit alpha [Pseudomonadota bacterium]
MTFLKDGWYCAGWKKDVTEKPRAITICGEEIVLFRDADGRAVVLENRCPHRFAPLSQGRVMGNVIQCPYHGLEFDRSGMCVLNPHGQKVIPPRAAIKSYRAEEKYGAVWVWMGDPAAADPEAIISLPFIEDERYAVVTGYFHVKANYQLLNDNLLDLTHSAYIHTTTVGLPPDIAATVKYTVRSEGNVIRSERFLSNVPPTPQFLNLFKEPLGDIYSYLSWFPPSSMLLDLSVVPHGSPKRPIEEPTDDAVLIPGAHLVVPETQDTAHYFYAVARSAAIDDASKTEAMGKLSYQTFVQEDAPMIEECYRLMGGKEFYSLQPAILESDRGGILARRILAKLTS